MSSLQNMSLSPALLEQPSFPEFDEALVAQAKEKRFIHTGAFVSRNEELCRAVCTDLLNGVGRRVIAKRYGISRNTVNAIREVMESRGELEPLKKEIARRLDRCVIYSLENLEEALSEGEIAAGSLPIATAVLLDKKAALEGAPTARIEHITRKISHEDLNAWLDSLPSANPTDSASAGAAAQLPTPQEAKEATGD